MDSNMTHKQAITEPLTKGPWEWYTTVAGNIIRETWNNSKEFYQYLNMKSKLVVFIKRVDWTSNDIACDTS